MSDRKPSQGLQSFALTLATGRGLDAIGAELGVIRLPAEPDARYRARLVEHKQNLIDREWGI